MKPMTRDRALEFLQEGTRTGNIATVREDGRPHVVPVWFVLEGDDVLFTTWHTSVKARNLDREGRAAMSVDVPDPPYAYLLVEGPVTIVADPEESRRVATAAGARYMGEDRAEEFGRRNGVEGELVVRLHIEHFVGADDMAG
ncbi:MAG TPA: PPOX class F420-dependent oxidoreductase [Acidimicrobiia bacterium]